MSKKYNFDWLWFFVFTQGVNTSLLVTGAVEPRFFTIAHEDYIFIALLCTAFIRDSILIKGEIDESKN